MAEYLKDEEKSKTFTTIPIIIHKKLSVCGDKEEKRIWKGFFEDKKESSYLKNWLIEAYQEIERRERGLPEDCKKEELNIQTYQDIFECDEDWNEGIKMLINKMFRKINKIYFPEVFLKDSKQHFLKLKLEDEIKKKDE
jgi:hypothetical protein